MEPLDLRQYDDWLADHKGELVTQYAGKVVVIYEGRVAFATNSEIDAYQWVRVEGLKSIPLVFRVPREKDVHSILSAKGYNEPTN